MAMSDLCVVTAETADRWLHPTNHVLVAAKESLARMLFFHLHQTGRSTTRLSEGDEKVRRNAFHGHGPDSNRFVAYTLMLHVADAPAACGGSP